MSSEQVQLGAASIEAEPLPPGAEPLPGETCWHCRNSVHQRHSLLCIECGYEIGGPAIQHQPNCRSCAGQNVCIRATWRLRGEPGAFKKAVWVTLPRPVRRDNEQAEEAGP